MLKLKKIVGFTKQSFLMARKRDSLVPVIRRSLASAFVYFLCFVFTISFFYFRKYDLSFFVLTLLMITAPYLFYYHMKMRFILSAIVSEHVTGNKRSFDEIKAEIESNSLKIAFVLITEYFLKKSIISNNRDEAPGSIISRIKAIVLGSFGEIGNIAKNYIIPSFVVEKFDLSSVVKKLDFFKTEFPEMATVSLSLNLIESLMSRLLKLFSWLILAFSVFVGFILSKYIPDILVSEVPSLFKDLFSFIPAKISYVPVIFGVYFILFLLKLKSILIESFEGIYFTILYVSVSSPEKINKEIRSKIGHLDD